MELAGKWFLLVGILGLVLGLASNTFAQTPDPFFLMYGHYDGPGVSAEFEKIMPPFTAVEGTSTDANFINSLRVQGKVYAAHVTNPTNYTTSQLVALWRAPFENTLGGQLPGGYDAIAIDELRNNANGTTQSNRVVAALQQLRALYPSKQIYAASTSAFGSDPSTYSDQLNAVNNYVDRLMLEVYIREGNPSYGWLAGHPAAYAPKIEAVVSGILSKTVYGLYIPQGNYVADDTTNVGFWGHLDEQFHRIRNDPHASTMPGLMFWPYYQSVTDLTPDYVARLIDHYYTKGNTSYFGDGNTTQLITNAQFDPNTAGWTLTPGSGGTVAQFDYSSVIFDNDHDGFGQASHGQKGLKMIRGTSPNEVSFQVSGLDQDMFYTVSAWVMAETTGQRAKLTITEPDGTYIDSKEVYDVGNPPNWDTKWNEWSRIIFNFVPTSGTINVVLSDETTAEGTTLYWDFVELEGAYLVPELPLPGDANGDGMVSADDYGSVQANFGNTGDPWIPGDANGTGTVSGDDYASVQLNFGDTPGLEGDVPVPEPATLSLLGAAGVMILRRRR